MTPAQVNRLATLLLKIVKLQYTMRGANEEQRKRIFEKAEPVIVEVVRDFGGDRLWIEALLTFGGQYYSEKTVYWLGEAMLAAMIDGKDDWQVLDSLKRDICIQNDLPFFWLDEGTVRMDDYEKELFGDS